MFARPTLAELIDRIRGDLRGRLEIGGALLRRAMADVLATVWAGAVHMLYGFIDWAVKQMFATTAEREQLLKIAAPYGITLEPAEFATGTATATGTNGLVIPAGTVLSLDSVTEYTVTADAICNTGPGTPPVNAVLSLQASLAGTAANVPNGTVLRFKNPIAGVESTAIVTGDITNGVDEEDIEHLRARLLLRMQEPPEGGADQDYEAWSLEVAGVTRVWVYPNELGLGTVVVRFVIDNADGTVTFPSVGQVAAVQAKLDAERPITAAVTAMAPTNGATAFTIHVVPDNSNTRAAVTAELADLFRREAEAGDGAGRGTVLLSHMRTAIGSADGVTDYSMTVPAADVVPASGVLPTVGTITFV